MSRRNANWYTERIAIGLCGRCGVRPPVYGLKSCDRCRSKDAARHRRKVGGVVRARACSVCKEVGHDIRSCPNPYPLEQLDLTESETRRVERALEVTKYDCANRSSCLLECWPDDPKVLDCTGCDAYEPLQLDVAAVRAARSLLSVLKGEGR